MNINRHKQTKSITTTQKVDNAVRYWIMVDWTKFKTYENEYGRTFADVDMSVNKPRDNVADCLNDLLASYRRLEATSTYYVLIHVVPSQLSMIEAIRTDCMKVKVRVYRQVGVLYPSAGRGQLDEDVIKALAELIEKEAVTSVEIPPITNFVPKKENAALTVADLEFIQKSLRKSHADVTQSLEVYNKLKTLIEKENGK